MELKKFSLCMFHFFPILSFTFLPWALSCRGLWKCVLFMFFYKFLANHELWHCLSSYLPISLSSTSLLIKKTSFKKTFFNIWNKNFLQGQYHQTTWCRKMYSQVLKQIELYLTPAQPFNGKSFTQCVNGENGNYLTRLMWKLEITYEKHQFTT